MNLSVDPVSIVGKASTAELPFCPRTELEVGKMYIVKDLISDDSGGQAWTHDVVLCHMGNVPEFKTSEVKLLRFLSSGKCLRLGQIPATLFFGPLDIQGGTEEEPKKGMEVSKTSILHRMGE